MGKSTSSTGPFSIAKCKKLPEGIYNIYIHYESVLNWKEAITIIVVDSSYWREDGIRVDTTELFLGCTS